MVYSSTFQSGRSACSSVCGTVDLKMNIIKLFATNGLIFNCIKENYRIEEFADSSIC